MTICLFSCFENLTIATDIFISAENICFILCYHLRVASAWLASFFFLFCSFDTSEKHNSMYVCVFGFICACFESKFLDKNKQHAHTRKKNWRPERKKNEINKGKRENEIDDHLPINPCLWYNQRAKCHSNNIVTSCYLVTTNSRSPYLARELIKFGRERLFDEWSRRILFPHCRTTLVLAQHKHRDDDGSKKRLN